jgi:hypothetical protein
MKNQLSEIDATPSKRIYLSIISDYHLTTALCELIDNAIDSWIYNGRKSSLNINITLDYQQQTIYVVDNSGGIPEKDIKLIISPGESRNEDSSNSIGLFGVGSKRAVVALSQHIKISSRHKSNKTLLIEFDDNWISDPNWNILLYEIDDICPNTTIIELDKLRDVIVSEDENRLISHLGATYASFIEDQKDILTLNGKLINKIDFESWSYPPSFEPKKYNGALKINDDNSVDFDIIAGLTQQGDPSGGEYGIYMYCNDRLIARAYKGYELGFRAGMAGQPHPSISLTRVIIKLKGKAQLMPWNSSKSEINIKHPTFKALQEYLLKIVTNYARASKNMSDDWNIKVFPYKKGIIREVPIENLNSNTNLYLVPIPRKISHKYIDIIKSNNKQLSNSKPWVKGTYEAIIAIDEISKLKIEQSNRISLLILDSTLEIAFKDYLVNESNVTYSASRLEAIMKNRTDVHNEIQKYIQFKKDTWPKVIYFYNLRCELVHKRIAATISNEDLKIYRDLVEYMFKKMFNLNFNI